MPSKTASLLVQVASILFISACHPAPMPPTPLTLAVDSTAYHRRGQAPVTVPFAIANTGSTPLYVSQCDGSPAPVIDRLIWGNWRFWEGGFCNGGSSVPLLLPPGNSVLGMVAFYSGGHFRLRVGTTTDPQSSGSRVIASREFDVW